MFGLQVSAGVQSTASVPVSGSLQSQDLPGPQYQLAPIHLGHLCHVCGSQGCPHRVSERAS